MKPKLLFIIPFISLFYNPIAANENGMWNFVRKRQEESKKENFFISQKFALETIRLYQFFLSEQQADVCNFTPSCSHYAYKSIKMHGSIKGFLMAIDRLQRCNPWSWNYLNKYYKVEWVKGRGYKLYDPP